MYEILRKKKSFVCVVLVYTHISFLLWNILETWCGMVFVWRSIFRAFLFTCDVNWLFFCSFFLFAKKIVAKKNLLVPHTKRFHSAQKGYFFKSKLRLVFHAKSDKHIIQSRQEFFFSFPTERLYSYFNKLPPVDFQKKH